MTEDLKRKSDQAGLGDDGSPSLKPRLEPDNFDLPSVGASLADVDFSTFLVDNDALFNSTNSSFQREFEEVMAKLPLPESLAIPDAPVQTGQGAVVPVNDEQYQTIESTEAELPLVISIASTPKAGTSQPEDTNPSAVQNQDETPENETGVAGKDTVKSGKSKTNKKSQKKTTKKKSSGSGKKASKSRSKKFKTTKSIDANILKTSTVDYSARVREHNETLPSRTIIACDRCKVCVFFSVTVVIVILTAVSATVTGHELTSTSIRPEELLAVVVKSLATDVRKTELKLDEMNELVRKFAYYLKGESERAKALREQLEAHGYYQPNGQFHDKPMHWDAQTGAPMNQRTLRQDRQASWEKEVAKFLADNPPEDPRGSGEIPKYWSPNEDRQEIMPLSHIAVQERIPLTMSQRRQLQMQLYYYRHYISDDEPDWVDTDDEDEDKDKGDERGGEEEEKGKGKGKKTAKRKGKKEGAKERKGKAKAKAKEEDAEDELEQQEGYEEEEEGLKTPEYLDEIADFEDNNFLTGEKQVSEQVELANLVVKKKKNPTGGSSQPPPPPPKKGAKKAVVNQEATDALKQLVNEGPTKGINKSTMDINQELTQQPNQPEIPTAQDLLRQSGIQKQQDLDFPSYELDALPFLYDEEFKAPAPASELPQQQQQQTPPNQQQFPWQLPMAQEVPNPNMGRYFQPPMAPANTSTVPYNSNLMQGSPTGAGAFGRHHFTQPQPQPQPQANSYINPAQFLHHHYTGPPQATGYPQNMGPLQTTGYSQHTTPFQSGMPAYDTALQSYYAQMQVPPTNVLDANGGNFSIDPAELVKHAQSMQKKQLDASQQLPAQRVAGDARQVANMQQTNNRHHHPQNNSGYVFARGNGNGNANANGMMPPPVQGHMMRR
ncbi:hypothetical protein BO70DRAFT_426013 [Aspergillus heteromorphus CBS 117.55]|uniref:Uncharacterized protein n=1 Tax=Aspergillus heteromorphus CBS 117.55 TaxID=1448321 RepID=A0A317X0R1_9EURO|nr:uncharacterized protein BO70DRAFT_426013 [Aspergillus heteromorphus CBS 117.55]PWY91117.1 hypothetical protein BO70DRAFT_426013 [Aspergillus heteromorphus CBS 117.55]